MQPNTNVSWKSVAMDDSSSRVNRTGFKIHCETTKQGLDVHPNPVPNNLLAHENPSRIPVAQVPAV